MSNQVERSLLSAEVRDTLHWTIALQTRNQLGHCLHYARVLAVALIASAPSRVSADLSLVHKCIVFEDVIYSKT